MLSPDGRCKTFDASVDGFGRGEGCGAVFLTTKHASNTIAELVTSGVNQDGRSAGLTAPNGPSQAALIQECLAGANPDTVSVFDNNKIP